MANESKRNKDRLYIGLYVRGGVSKMPGQEDRYHWALLTGPKTESPGSIGMKYHAKNRIGEKDFNFEESRIPITRDNALLVRILIAKITNRDQLRAILRRVPIEQEGNCVTWIRDAFERLNTDTKALGNRVVDWQTVRDAAMGYVERKKAEHRFDGQSEPGKFDISVIATFDLLQGKETIR